MILIGDFVISAGGQGTDEGAIYYVIEIDTSFLKVVVCDSNGKIKGGEGSQYVEAHVFLSVDEARQSELEELNEQEII